MNLATMLARFGYWTVLLGAFVEGETIVLMGGFAAHRGYLHVLGVIACAFAGSLAGDQLAYLLGRRYGERILHRRPKWRPTVERVRHELSTRGTWLLVSFRFFYGLRNAVPFAAGLSGIPPRRFAPLNALGAAIWAPTIALAGYVFGTAFERVLHRARRYEALALICIAVAGLVLYLVRRARAAHRQA